MGEKIVYPGEPYDPAKGYLYYARTCLDTLIAEGTDRYGETRSPMFASLLDMETHAIPDDAPPNVPGQRSGDRTLRGGNLFHDVMLLRACDAATALTGDPKYRDAASAYLAFFLEHCPQPGEALGRVILLFRQPAPPAVGQPHLDLRVRPDIAIPVGSAAKTGCAGYHQ